MCNLALSYSHGDGILVSALKFAGTVLYKEMDLLLFSFVWLMNKDERETGFESG